MKEFSKTVAELVQHPDESPLPLEVIPNYMGINLVSVDRLAWSEQDDGQLIDLTIHFKPEPEGCSEQGGPDSGGRLGYRHDQVEPKRGSVLCDQCGQEVAERADRSGIVAHRCPHGVECVLERGDPRIGRGGWGCGVCRAAAAAGESR